MLAITLEITADTSSSIDDPVQPFSTSLELSAGTFATRGAVVKLNGTPFVSGTARVFFESLTQVSGRPVSGWVQAAAAAGATVFGSAPNDTVSQNALKALLLVAQWTEPTLVAGEISALEKALDRQIVVDYSGKIGAQAYIFFPRQAETKSLKPRAIERLYRLHL